MREGSEGGKGGGKGGEEVREGREEGREGGKGGASFYCLILSRRAPTYRPMATSAGGLRSTVMLLPFTVDTVSTSKV